MSLLGLLFGSLVGLSLGLTGGGGAIFADPVDIADRYHRAVEAYQAGLRRAVLESAVDYHRVLTGEPAEQALARFLVGRAAGRGLR